MHFHSLTFLLFIGAIFIIYQVIGGNYRKYILLISSYIFYGYDHTPHLGLLVGVTIFTYFSSIYFSSNKKRIHLIIAIFVLLIPLTYYKIIHFFSEHSVQNSQSNNNSSLIDFLLPIGISFYTFQAISYIIDTYRGIKIPKVGATDLALYLAFFPQVLAGPIERGGKLIPQLINLKPSINEDTYIGLKILTWGFFCKLVIADNIGQIIDPIFSSHLSQSGSSLTLATVLYSFQIFFDFLGYTNIAIGSARIFSVKLSPNFYSPYFSRSMSEFWRRWHVTLSTWFRDYMYIPLGGNRNSGLKLIILITLVFTTSGLWHGVSLGFIAWGFYHAFFYYIDKLFPFKKKLTISEPVIIGALRNPFRVLITFTIITMGWILFRSDNLSQSLEIYNIIFNASNDSWTNLDPIFKNSFNQIIFGLILISITIDAAGVKLLILDQFPKTNRNIFLELIIINFLILSIIFLSSSNNTDFIYRRF